MVTPGQARYLLAIRQMRGRSGNMSRLAEILDVSKPSVTSMIASLEEREWVSKGPPLVLTAQGKALAEEIKSRQSLLTGYFSKELGLSEEDIANDILLLMLTVSEKFIGRLTGKIEKEEAQAELRKFSENVHMTNFQGILSDGIYEIPFRLLKKNGRQLSMGDKGFVHPARLIIADGHGIIRLRTLPVMHRTLRGNVLKGRLARLFYWNGEDFSESLEQDGVYSFPVMEMHWSHDREKNADFGLVQVKVHASVGVFNMPDSVADLAIYFE